MASVRRYAAETSTGAAQQIPDGEEDGKGGAGEPAQVMRALCNPGVQIDLMETIEAEIIPRLMLAHRPRPGREIAPLDARPPPTAEEISEFAALAVTGNPSTVVAYVEQLCTQGLSVETLLLELLAPAARLLGDLWTADLRTFTDVSVGLANLQQVVYALGPLFAPDVDGQSRGLVVLAPAPGEHHTLGLHLVGELIRKAGWTTQVEAASTERGLVALVQDENVAMLGISVSNTEFVQPLAGIISAVRASSCNKDLLVVLGGAIALDDYVVLTGATACASGARQAVQLLERHAARLVARH